MYVFDYPKYEDATNYCPGKHAVCDRLIAEGRWEPHDTIPIRKMLEDGSRNNLVIDFGAHCGWYTIMAAQLGYMVWAVEGDPEVADLLRENIALHRYQDRVTVIEAWVDGEFVLPEVGDRDIELVKSDLEGNELYAVAAVEPFIEKVENFYLEISPCFADYYPGLVDDLYVHGFRAYYPNNKAFRGDFSPSQLNLRFSRT